MQNPHLNTAASSSKLLFVALFSIAILALLPALSLPFITTGEPREAVVAQSMILKKDLLYSVRYADEIATKPPLLHWLMVLMSKLSSGISEASTRLPSVFASALAAGLWTLFILPELGIQRALLGFVILLSSAEWYRHAALARVDMVLAACMSLSLILLYRWMRNSRNLDLILALAPLALGALSKGPVAIALPVAICGLALIYWRELTPRKLIQLAFISAISLLPLILWYYLSYQRFGGHTIEVSLSENLARLSGTMSSGEDPHAHGPLFLIGAFFVGLLPWSLLFSPALPGFWKNRQQILKENEVRRIFEWCLIITLFIFAFFLIPSSKRGVYLLPAYPAVSTLLAIVFSDFTQRRTEIAKRMVAGVCYTFLLIWSCVVILLLGVIDPALFLKSEKKLFELHFYLDSLRLNFAQTPLAALLDIAIPLMLLSACLWLFKQQTNNPFLRLGITILLIFSFVKSTIVMPIARSLSPREFVLSEIQMQNPPVLALFSDRMYAEIFYARLAKPDLILEDYNQSQKYILMWKEDENAIEDVLLAHDSPKSIHKPARYLKYVERRN